MICKDFLNLFDKSNSFELSSQMLEHVAACAKCKQVVDVQKNAENCLSILQKSTPKVDFTARIMANVLAEPGPLQQSPGTSVPSMPAGWSPLAAPAVALVLCASLVIGLIFVSSDSKNVPAPLELSQKSGWEMTMVADKAETIPNIFSPISSSEIVRMNDNQKAIVKFGDGIKWEMMGGSFVPSQNGLVVFSGTARITIKEGASLFSIGTPFGEIRPESGSQLILRVNDDGLHLLVQSGSVKASYISQTVEVKANQEIKIGKDGFSGQTASASVQSNTAVDSLFEQGNPGN